MENKIEIEINDSVASIMFFIETDNSKMPVEIFKSSMIYGAGFRVIYFPMMDKT
jgi:hypothetical protein